MTRGPLRAIVAAVASLLFPGLGAGLVGKSRVMYAWVGAATAVTLATVASIWLFPLGYAVRIAAAIGGFRVVRDGDREGARSSWAGVIVAIALNVAASYAIRLTALEALRTPSTSMAPTLAIGDHIFVDKLTPHVRAIGRGEVIVFRQPCQPDVDYVKRVIALAGETVEVRCNAAYVNGKPLPVELVQGDGCSYEDQDEATQQWSHRGCSEYLETAGPHPFRTFHDPDRPKRDAEPATRRADVHDFPVVDGSRLPPSCPEIPDRPNPFGQLPGSVVETRHDAGPCELQLHYAVPPDHVFVMGDNRSNSNDSRYWGSVPLSAIRGRVLGIWVSIGAPGFTLSRFGSIQ